MEHSALVGSIHLFHHISILTDYGFGLGIWSGLALGFDLGLQLETAGTESLIIGIQTAGTQQNY